MTEERLLSMATPAPSLPPTLPVVDSTRLEDLEAPLEPPRRSFLASGPSIPGTPRDSRAESTTGPENERSSPSARSTAYLPVGRDSYTEAPLSEPVPKSRPFYRRPIWLAIAAGTLVAVILAIALPVSLSHKSKHTQSNNSGKPGKPGSNGPGNGNPNSPNNTSNAITGGDGSTIVSGGTSFVYNNSFGGFCEFLFYTKTFLRTWAPDGRHMM